jgi:hypothetical protein
MSTTQSPSREAGERTAGRRPYLMLGMAAVGFALTFWAWALLSPLGAHFKQSLGLTSFQQALAVPVIVGALGRIPGLGFPEHVQEHAADVGIPDPCRRVRVPGERGPRGQPRGS